MKALTLPLIIFLMSFGVAIAQTALSDSTKDNGSMITKDNGSMITEAKRKVYEKFQGIEFGVGLALTFKHGHNRVSDATVAGGIVRVERETNRDPKIMLETHYFFLPQALTNELKTVYGVGPFLAIQPNSSGGDVIGAYALGGMIGLKRLSENSSDKSWNIGVGYVVNTNVKVLGDGIENGKPLPEGETQVRFKQINQPGWLIISSFTF